MKEFAQVLQSLYNSFLFRDVAAKVLPGFILFMALSILIQPINDTTKLLSSLSAPLVFIFFLAFWVLGFAVQALGTRSKIVKYSYRYPAPDRFHEALRQYKNTKLPEGDGNQLERFMVIRESYGNNSVAVFLSTAIYVGHRVLSPAGFDKLAMSFLCFGIFISLFLYLGHRETINNQDSFWYHALAAPYIDDHSKKEVEDKNH